MSEARRYLEDVNQFNSFLKLNSKSKTVILMKEKKQNFNSYKSMKLALKELGEELRSK